MANVIKTIIQFRRAKTAEWLAYKDVVPAAGEPCFDVELKTLKIGDGETTYENLPAIGGTSVNIDADGKSIVLEDNVFKLIGFDAAEVGAQPRKAANGKLEWVMPSTETVEGLQSAVSGLQSDVNSLQNTVTTIKEIVLPSGDGAATLLSRLESIETKVDGTGDGTVDAKIDAKINEFASRISDDGTINTFKELIDYVATHGKEYASVVKGISVNGDLLDMINGVVNIPAGVGLKTSDEIVVNEDGTLSIGTLSFDKLVQNDNQIVVFDGGGASG